MTSLSIVLLLAAGSPAADTAGASAGLFFRNHRKQTLQGKPLCLILHHRDNPFGDDCTEYCRDDRSYYIEQETEGEFLNEI